MRTKEVKKMVFIARDGEQFIDAKSCYEHEEKAQKEVIDMLGNKGKELPQGSREFEAIDGLIEDGRAESRYFIITDTDTICRCMCRDWHLNDIFDDEKKTYGWKTGITRFDDLKNGKTYIVCVNPDLGTYVYSVVQLVADIQKEIDIACGF